MWSEISPFVGIAGRTLLIYVVVLAGIRLSGKREVGQMTPFDLVLLLLLANAVQNAMTGPDTTLLGGGVAAVTLLAANKLLSLLSWRSRRVRTFLEGAPQLLIRSGQLLEQNMIQERLTIAELEQALREHGVATIKDVALAVLEIDGTISVLKKEDVPTMPRQRHRVRFMRS
jgi:uncharacterized membrane protein YcaP (DUF421 family)